MCAEPVPQSADRILHAVVIMRVFIVWLTRGGRNLLTMYSLGQEILVNEYAVYTARSPFLISSRSACLFFDCAFHSHFFLYPSYPVPPQDAEPSGHSQTELQ